MDEETKEAISALLGETRKKRHVDTKEELVRKYTSAMFEKVARETLFDDPIKKAHFREPDKTAGPADVSTYIKTPKISSEGITFVDSTQTETAILSINPAKACVVLRANMTQMFYDELKREINTKLAWNSTDKVFEVNPTALPQIKLLLKNHYKDVQVFGIQKQVRATKFDKLMDALTKDDKSKIYRLLAGIYHPDRGGNKDTMALINEVFK